MYDSQIISKSKQNIKLSGKETYITECNIFIDKESVLEINTRNSSIENCNLFIGKDSCLEIDGDVDVSDLDLTMKNDYIYINDTEISKSSLEGSVILDGSEIESTNIKCLSNNYKGNKNIHDIINIRESKIKGTPKCDISGNDILIDRCNINGDNYLEGNIYFVDCDMKYINNIQSDMSSNKSFKSCKFQHTFIDVRDDKLVENKDLTRVGYGI